MDSLEKFYERSKEIKNLEKMVKELNPPMTRKQRDRMSVLTRASVVMLCGHVEGYLEDIVKEFVNRLCENNIFSEKIPHELKEKYIKKDFHETFNEYKEKNTKKLFLDYNELWEDGHSLSQGDISGECITEEFNNPEPNKIKNLFGQIGLSNILEGNELIKFIPNIETLVQRRHKIVHGDMSETPTPDDVAIYADAVLNLARVVARRVKNHLKYKYNIILQ